MLINKKLNKILLTGILTSVALHSMAADSTTGNSALNGKNEDNAAAKTEPTGDVMTVHAPEIEKKAGSSVSITANDMQKNGGNDFGTIMRYQPLISATGSSGGSNTGKSGFDRGGYTATTFAE